MHAGSWANYRQQDTRKPKSPTATSEELGTKARYCTHFLQTPPPKGWADHLSHPSSLSPGHTPTVTPYKEPAWLPSSSERAKETVRDPNKVLSEFLAWPLVNFY